MLDVKWIKLSVDMFDNKKIRYLRRLPEGNNIVLIWVMLLTLAGRCNSGGMIFLTENIPYTPKMLADELDFKENTVCLALAQLEQLGMIYTDEECFVVTNWNRYQSLDRNADLREYNRLAKQRSRQRMSLTAQNDVNDTSMTCQDCQAEEERREIEKEESTREEEKQDVLQSIDLTKDEAKRSYLGGKLGRGVVLLSDEQLDDLLDKLSLDEFNKYVEVVANNELRGHHYKKRTHYTAIIEMATKDRRLL